ncbi:hypothetical protein O3P69_018572 [Scylla paramamosain]|uniref:N(6)-adenine-specific DNA methyltransferase 2 n=1 Tax=Scylla paramamosain TaxID=85552 RepID=A0AAW0T1Q8_SCYPA
MNSVEEDQRRRREEEEEEEDESISLSVSVSEDSEEVPQLSAATLGALLEFYGEEEERQDRLRDVQEGEIPDTFTENWNLSQFWYSDTTSQRLASECLRVAGDKGAIACLSCPTLYRTLRAQEHQCQVSLLEYDTRFACFGSDFYFYDYRSPLALDNTLRGAFDLVVADPPSPLHRLPHQDLPHGRGGRRQNGRELRAWGRGDGMGMSSSAWGDVGRGAWGEEGKEGGAWDGLSGWLRCWPGKLPLFSLQRPRQETLHSTTSPLHSTLHLLPLRNTRRDCRCWR